MNLYNPSYKSFHLYSNHPLVLINPNYRSFKLYLNHPVDLYIHRYCELVRENRFRGRLSWNFLLWYILAATNLIDTLVTYYVFAKGGIEVNPAMAFFCVQFGEISIAFFKWIVLGMLLVLLPLIRVYLQKLLYLASVFYIVVVFTHVLRF